MVRMSKQGERRAKCPHRCRPPMQKTGAKKDNLPKGFKNHANAAAGDQSNRIFIPKIG